jgi:hypothetical protein
MKLMLRVAGVVAAFILVSLSTPASAWQDDDKTEPVAKGADLYCTGFISDASPRADLQIIGAVQENMKATYAQGDVVFLSKGREAGVQPGAVYYIIRPLGLIKHPFSKKKLGHYVRELGLLRVIEVSAKTSTAEILVSCDIVEFGDLLKPYEEMESPSRREHRPLPRYGEGSGGVTGQIVMSPGFYENLSANRVVFLDLGARQDVKPGDYFTIYREIGPREGITVTPKDDVVKDRSRGYSSDRYRGGNLSVQAPRKPLEDVLKTRPEIPRKVLGELVVLKVEKNTCVAKITRTTDVVTIGDFVERAN